ncbi:hypothetical protein ACWAT4_31525 [Bradyrhizobium manausense]
MSGTVARKLSESFFKLIARDQKAGTKSSQGLEEAACEASQKAIVATEHDAVDGWAGL